MTDVVVVGSGVSGLYTAKGLLAKGLSVLVVEAADYVGGRVKQTNPGDFVPWRIDVGGEIIHGKDTHFYNIYKEQGWKMRQIFNSFPKLEEQFGTEKPVEYWHLPKQLGDTFVNWKNSDKEVNVLWAAMHKLLKMSDEEAATTFKDRKVSLLQYLTSQGVSTNMINLADALYGKVWATRLDELGANESRLEDGGPHPGFETNYHANDSFKQLIDYLSAGLQIRLNWQVKNVQVLPNKKGVRVVNQKGESIEAKHVVIAVPLPILQDGDITFEPALPKKKQVALSKLRMGHALKVILKFNKPFWNPKSQLIICSEALFPQMWPGGGAARNSSVFTMTAFVSGDCATKVSSLDDASKVRLFAAQLDSMYGTPSEPHPATKAMTGSMVFDWQKMPFVRGGYTYPATGSVNAKEEMVSYEPTDRVYFAGEMVCIDGGMGTIHGAMNSAERAISSVLKNARPSKL